MHLKALPASSPLKTKTSFWSFFVSPTQGAAKPGLSQAVSTSLCSRSSLSAKLWLCGMIQSPWVYSHSPEWERMDHPYCVVPCVVIGILAKELLTWVSQEYRPGQGPRMTNWDPGGDTRHLKSSLSSRLTKLFAEGRFPVLFITLQL